jgi:DNA-binding transcriptional LysR family regulator
MNLRPIEIFIMVARHRSFSRAAERLHIAQSAVSIAVRRLEAELGTVLLSRTSRSVELTPAGERYLLRVQPALEQLELASREARERDGELRGVLMLASPAMVTQFALARPLVAFQASHPELQLRLRQGGAEEIRQWVLAGDVELGITAERESHSELDVVQLVRLPNVAVVQEGSPLAKLSRLPWRELLQQPLVTFPTGYHQRWLIEHHASKRGIVPKIALESENLGVIVEAVRGGLGVTTVPALAVQGQGGVAAVRLEAGDVLTVGACMRRGFARSNAGEALLRHLRRSLKV